MRVQDRGTSAPRAMVGRYEARNHGSDRLRRRASRSSRRTGPAAVSNTVALTKRIQAHLAALYPHADLPELTDRVLSAIGLLSVAAHDHADHQADEPTSPWTAADAILITYGDSITDGRRPPLQVLTELMEHLAETIGVVHVLPFSPSSSDRGFSVIDYTSIDPDLGTWGDVESLAATVDLMADLVCNHASTDSSWFRELVANEPPGRDYFVTVDAHADTSTVVRPRTFPLIQTVETRAGPRHVWCTFSHDQADLDYSNPDVLLEMLRVLDLYITAGARFIRLDAVAYLWKQLGTPCIHLPQTHEMIRLWRTLLRQRAPHVGLITETNVPNEENLSYFGTGDEAHLIYNFTLPPLVIDALLRGRSGHLTSWMHAMPPAPEGCTYLNFLASHDGIGLRPAAGLLSPGEINGLVATTEARGGLHGTYATPDGPLPYELNIALWDLLAGTAANSGDGAQVDRFVCAHAIMFGLAGIPALYVNSLFAQPSDPVGAAASGVRRDINRSGIELKAALALLEDPSTTQGEATARLLALLRTRGAQSAFHPDAGQRAIDLGNHIVGFQRSSTDGLQTILAISNCTADNVTVAFVDLPDLDATTRWDDLVAGKLIDLAARNLVLAPYQTVWITNTGVGVGVS